MYGFQSGTLTYFACGGCGLTRLAPHAVIERGSSEHETVAEGFDVLKGVAALLKIIKTVQARLNPRLQVLGLLPTFYDSRTILGRDMLDSLKDTGDHRVFRTVIRQSVKIGEAPTAGVPITSYDSRSDAAKSFMDLAKEVAGAH